MLQIVENTLQTLHDSAILIGSWVCEPEDRDPEAPNREQRLDQAVDVARGALVDEPAVLGLIISCLHVQVEVARHAVTLFRLVSQVRLEVIFEVNSWTQADLQCETLCKQVLHSNFVLPRDEPQCLVRKLFLGAGFFVFTHEERLLLVFLKE